MYYSIKPFLQSKEYQLTLNVKDSKAVKIKDGDCINADGWFEWDKVAEASELLELVNKLYEEDLKKLMS